MLNVFTKIIDSKMSNFCTFPFFTEIHSNHTISKGIPFIFIAMYAISSSYLFAFWTKHDRKYVKRFYKSRLRKIPFLRNSIKNETEHHGFGGIMDENDVEKMTRQRKKTIAHHSEGKQSLYIRVLDF